MKFDSFVDCFNFRMESAADKDHSHNPNDVNWTIFFCQTVRKQSFRMVTKLLVVHFHGMESILCQLVKVCVSCGGMLCLFRPIWTPTQLMYFQPTWLVFMIQQQTDTNVKIKLSQKSRTGGFWTSHFTRAVIILCTRIGQNVVSENR